MQLVFNIIIAMLMCSPAIAGAACLQGDCTTGPGTAVLPDGSRYVGEFREGVRAGRGAMAYPGGTRYEGSWQNDRFHGNGTLTSAGKFEYTGEFANGVRHGQGTLKIFGGKSYVGQWQDDRPHGQGTLTDPGREEFTGQFKNGRRHGQGEAVYSDGARYKGEWADGLPNGRGVKTLADGMQYAGEFRNGAMHGSGTIILSDGNQLKVKWQNNPSPREGANLPEAAASYNGTRKEWYMTATPAESLAPFNLGPAPSAGPMKVASQERDTAEESTPRESGLPAAFPEQGPPRTPAEDEIVAAEKVQIEMVTTGEQAGSPSPEPVHRQAPAIDEIALAEQGQTETTTADETATVEEIRPAAAMPAREKDTPEPGVALKHIPETIKAGEYASISVGANIRSKASLTSKILRTVPAGFPVIVLEKQADWFLVKDFRERKGWVFAPLVTAPGTVIISVFKANLRSGPNLQNTIIAQLDHGKIMSVLERSGEWLKVVDSAALTGWLHRKVIWP